MRVILNDFLNTLPTKVPFLNNRKIQMSDKTILRWFICKIWQLFVFVSFVYVRGNVIFMKDDLFSY